jgi:DNA-binding CsgD family transcriptional regulator
LNFAHVALGAADQRRLADVVHRIMCPLQQPTNRWLHGALGAVKELVGADTAGAAVPTTHGIIHCSPEKPVVWAQYAGMLEPMDRRFKIVQRARDFAVYNREMLWPDLKAYYASEYYNDYIVTNRMYDALCILVSAADRPAVHNSAQLIVHHEKPTGRTFGDRGLALFRLLRPAFEAAVRNHLALSAHAAALGSLVDALEEGVMLCDERGRLLHASTNLTRMLGLDPESDRVQRAMKAAAHTLARLLQPSPGWTLARHGGSLASDVATERARYRVRGTLIDPALLGGGARLLITLVRLTPELPTVSDLRARFGLTDRQARVALMLAEGSSNARLAARLGVSEHTARHHTEQVLARLGLRSRAGVGRLVTR